MTTSRSDGFPKLDVSDLVAPPYSQVEQLGHNTTKYGDVFCENCKYITRTNLRIPICGVCHGKLFVVVKSLLEGVPVNELVK